MNDTAYVILAAGRGSRIGRIGDDLHKSLVPLGGKAVLSHVIDQAPYGAKIIIVAGYMSQQINDYCRLAHPYADIEIVYVYNWNQPDGGPGSSLSAACRLVGDRNMIFTSCDTLWRKNEMLWNTNYSWSAVADLPKGTTPDRWCRMITHDSNSKVVSSILDKSSLIIDDGSCDHVYTGMSFIHRNDLDEFWTSLQCGAPIDGELQVSSGLNGLVNLSRLRVRQIDWTDVGDAHSYGTESLHRDGIDWSKPGQATYILPDVGRVIKWHRDANVATQCNVRGNKLINSMMIPHLHMLTQFVGYQYMPGITAYQAMKIINPMHVMKHILSWWNDLISNGNVKDNQCTDARLIQIAMEFYIDKTNVRITNIEDKSLRSRARALVDTISPITTIGTFRPNRMVHGDFNFGNIIISTIPESTALRIHPIDWRPNFGDTLIGDVRYDLGKLLAGCYVHWEQIRHNNFSRWTTGESLAKYIRDFCAKNELIYEIIRDIAVISLVNCMSCHPTVIAEHLIERAEVLMNEDSK